MKGRISDKARLMHIVDSIHLIENDIDGITYEDFINKPLLRLGVVKVFEIIGEAARHLSDETKNKHQEINWRDMIGLRNFLIHEYFDIDYELVWTTTSYLKEQKPKIAAINL